MTHLKTGAARLRRSELIAVTGIALLVADAGMILWYGAHHGVRPTNLPMLGYWTPLFYLAVVIAAVAAWGVARDVLRARDAILVCSIIAVAAAAVGVAVADQHLRRTGLALGTLDAMVRPLLSLLIVTLLVSALLGRGGSLSLSVGLIGAGMAATSGGQLWASYIETRGGSGSDRWPDLLWFGSSVFVLLAAVTIISGRDRPLRVSRSAVPGPNPALLAVVITGAWGAAGAVLVHGLLVSDTAEITAGGAAFTWIAMAALGRTTAALRETRHAYRALDEAHFALEQERERVQELVHERDEVIATLRQRNIELTTTQIMLGPLLDLADERTDGQLRSSLEQTADELASWLPPPIGSDG
jgi:hypothetical protein